MSPSLTGLLGTRVDRHLAATAAMTALSLGSGMAVLPVQDAASDIYYTSGSYSITYPDGSATTHDFIVIDFKTSSAPVIYTFSNSTYTAKNPLDDDYWAWKAYPSADAIITWSDVFAYSPYLIPFLYIDGTNDEFYTSFAVYSGVASTGATGIGYASKFAYGTKIDGSSTFHSYAYKSNTMIWAPGYVSPYAFPTVWTVGSYYLPIKLPHKTYPGLDFHYGWIGITLSKSAGIGPSGFYTYTATVTGVAWNTVSSGPIFAGTTIPEPGAGMLGALALGAMGVAAWRRRRKEEEEAA